MFRKLRNKIIIITMTITTVVLLLAGSSIMLISSTMRPDPIPRFERMVVIDRESLDTNSERSFPTPNFESQDLKLFIKSDREEGNNRLLMTLLSVGAIIEVAVFWITFFLSEKIVNPVKDSYDKQKIFIANASHELKTPLAVIQANMEALDVDKENEVWKNNIETEIAHANKLVLDLLQLARMDTGSIQKSTPEKVELAAEIKQRVEIFKAKFGGKISFKVEPKNPEYILAKQDLLQILDILLDNATKYGEKRINISLAQNTISISNDGTVVAKEDTEKIFDRFYQTDKTSDGSGLGLAIAKAICKQNGWNIVCKSSDKETTFKLSLS